MAAFLEQAAEARVITLQPLQGDERVRDSAQIALADGNHVEHVAVFRNLDGQSFGCAQRGTELIAFDESADAQDFRFGGGCACCYRGCLHCFQDEGGQCCPPSDSTAADLRGCRRESMSDSAQNL